MPGTDVPGTDVLGTDVPGTDVPGTDVPGTDVLGTDVPGTDVPGTDVPGTDVPGGGTTPIEALVLVGGAPFHFTAAAAAGSAVLPVPFARTPLFHPTADEAPGGDPPWISASLLLAVRGNSFAHGFSISLGELEAEMAHLGKFGGGSGLRLSLLVERERPSAAALSRPRVASQTLALRHGTIELIAPTEIYPRLHGDAPFRVLLRYDARGLHLELGGVVYLDGLQLGERWRPTPTWALGFGGVVDASPHPAKFWGVDHISLSELEVRTGTEVAHAVQRVTVSLNGQHAETSRLELLRYKAPRISTVLPAGGPVRGDTRVAIHASNFDQRLNWTIETASGVRVDPLNASEQLLEFITPPAEEAGAMTLGVSANGQQYAEAAQFTYHDETVLLRLSPASGPAAGGTRVRVSGLGMRMGVEYRCLFGESNVGAALGEGTSSAQSLDAVECVAPPQNATNATNATGAVVVAVSLNGQQYARNESAVVYEYYTSPSVVGVSPSSGPRGGGTMVNVSVRPHESGTQYVCAFGGQVVTATLAADLGVLSCATPASVDASSVAVEVSRNMQDFSSGGSRFQYHDNVLVSSISPSSGPATGETLVRLSGSGFANGSDYRCRFGACGACADEASWSCGDCVVGASVVSSPSGAIELLCISPNLTSWHDGSAANVSLEVSLNSQEYWGMSGSVSDLDASFGFYTPPVLSSVVPSLGPLLGGTRVRVSGFGLSGRASEYRCRFNGIETAVELDLVTGEIMFVTPPSTIAGGVQLSVSLNGQQFTQPLSFGYFNDGGVDSISPRSGPLDGGSMVRVLVREEMLIISGMSPEYRCRFGSVEVPALPAFPAALHCISPNTTAAGAVPLEVTLNGQQFSSDGVLYSHIGFAFEDEDQPSRELVSPSSGPVRGDTLLRIYAPSFGGGTAYSCRLNETIVVGSYDSTSELLRCRVPKEGLSLGTYAIALSTNTIDYAPYPSSFEVFAPVAFDALETWTGPQLGGTTLRVIGSNFETTRASDRICRFGTTLTVAASQVDAATLACVSPPRLAILDETITPWANLANLYFGDGTEPRLPSSPLPNTAGALLLQGDAAHVPDLALQLTPNAPSRGGALQVSPPTDMLPLIAVEVEWEILIGGGGAVGGEGIHLYHGMRAAGGAATLQPVQRGVSVLIRSETDEPRFPPFADAPPPVSTVSLYLDGSLLGERHLPSDGVRSNLFRRVRLAALRGSVSLWFGAEYGAADGPERLLHAAPPFGWRPLNEWSVGAVARTGSSHGDHHWVRSLQLRARHLPTVSPPIDVRVSTNAQQFSGASHGFSYYGGTELAANGTNLTDGSQVAEANLTYLTIDGLGNVGTPDQSDMKYDAAHPLSISSLRPSVGPVRGGSAVVVSGANFAGGHNYTCRIGGIVVDAQLRVAVGQEEWIGPSGDDAHPAGHIVCEIPRREELMAGAVSFEVSPNAQQYAEAAQFTYHDETVLLRLSPASGPAAGGTRVRVSGLGMRMGVEYRCLFGESNVGAALGEGTSSAQSLDAVECVAPPQNATNATNATGAVVVAVSLNGQQYARNESAVVYEYYTSPSVVGVSPSSGPRGGGTMVNVSVRPHESGTQYVCAFGGQVVTATLAADLGVLSCATPASVDASSVAVEVSRNMQDFSSGGSRFQYHDNVLVSSISPSSGPATGETLVRLSGSGFANGSDYRCRFGACGACADEASWSCGDCVVGASVVSSPSGAIELLCISPNLTSWHDGSAANVSLEVSLNSQEYWGMSGSVSDLDASFGFYTPPVLSSVVPSLGPLLGGTRVRVSGFGLSGRASEYRCRFNGIETAVELDLVTGEIMFVTPPSTIAGGVQLSVSLNGQQFTQPLSFGYFNDGGVDSISPRSGPLDGGSMVRVLVREEMLIISGMSPEYRCRFGSVEVPALPAFPAALHCISPNTTAAGAVPLEVTLNGQQFSFDGVLFTFVSQLRVSSVSPSLGPYAGNTSILVQAAGLDGGSAYRCRFSSASSDSVDVDATYERAHARLRCVSPSAVRAPLSVSVNAQQFTPTLMSFEPEPLLTKLGVSSGPIAGGTRVIVSTNGLPSRFTMRSYNVSDGNMTDVSVFDGNLTESNATISHATERNATESTDAPPPPLCRIGEATHVGTVDATTDAVHCLSPPTDRIGMWATTVEPLSTLPTASVLRGHARLGTQGSLELSGPVRIAGNSSSEAANGDGDASAGASAAADGDAASRGSIIIEAAHPVGSVPPLRVFKLSFHVHAASSLIGGESGAVGGDKSEISDLSDVSGVDAADASSGHVEGYSVSFGHLHSAPSVGAGGWGAGGAGDGLRVRFILGSVRRVARLVGYCSADAADEWHPNCTRVEMRSDLLEVAYGPQLAYGRNDAPLVRVELGQQLRANTWSQVRIVMSAEDAWGKSGVGGRLSVYHDSISLLGNLSIPSWAPSPHWGFGLGAASRAAPVRLRRWELSSPLLVSVGVAPLSLSFNGQQFGNSLDFGYYREPILTGVLPPHGPVAGGSLVRLDAMALADALAVRPLTDRLCRFSDGLLDVTANVTALDGAVLCVSPPRIGSGSSRATVRLSVNGQQFGAPIAFAIVPLPELSAAAPAVGPIGGGTIVAVYGDHLGANPGANPGANLAHLSRCSFGVPFPLGNVTVPASVAADGILVHCVSPRVESAGLVLLRLSTNGQQFSELSQSAEFIYSVPPVLEALEPSWVVGSAGTTVSLLAARAAASSTRATSPFGEIYSCRFGTHVALARWGNAPDNATRVCDAPSDVEAGAGAGVFSLTNPFSPYVTTHFPCTSPTIFAPVQNGIGVPPLFTAPRATTAT